MGSGALRRDGFFQAAMAAAVSMAAVLVATSEGCGSSDVVRADAGASCNQGDGSCPAGTVCTNRVCTPSCADGGACPSGFYCEYPQTAFAVCSPIKPSACRDDNDCPAGNQVCTDGLCISWELRADGGTVGCIISTTGSDACSPDSICYVDTSLGYQLNRCLATPHCGQDGSCPIGYRGSVCNQLADGGFAFGNKERLCLYKYCVGNTNCPTGTQCFHYTRDATLGTCSLGQSGYPCFSAEDCFNANYCQLSDGGVADGGLLPDGGEQLGTCY
jgi:Dickkopf N-terminal cysteine-rich region